MGAAMRRALGLLVVAGLAVGLTAGASSAAVAAPTVNGGAFAGHGRLAFVSGRTLWLLDGRALVRLPSGGATPSEPAFSHDGAWLVYVAASRLWLAHADGSGAHVVPHLAGVRLVGWSPRTDDVAVSAGPERASRPCPCFSATTVRLVSPFGPPRVVARARWVYGAAWSPDGRAIAVAEMGRNRARLVVYNAASGSARVWLMRLGTHRLNGMSSIVLTTAGWWRRAGIGVWVFGDGMVHNNDETPLDAVAAPGTAPRVLGQTLSDGTTDAVAGNASGDLALVADHGGGRAAWQDKSIVVCTTSCRVLPHSQRTVTVDPAWSPDGALLAYSEAPNVTRSPWTQRQVAAWFDAHRLFLYDADSGRRHAVPAAHGATAVTWSHDGKSLLYVRDDALWLLPTLAGRPVRIAAPLFRSRTWPQYYAQVAWAAQFAWRS